MAAPRTYPDELRERAIRMVIDAKKDLRGRARPPVPLVVDDIEEHTSEFGVESICEVLSSAGTKITPSTYCAAQPRAPGLVAQASTDGGRRGRGDGRSASPLTGKGRVGPARASRVL